MTEIMNFVVNTGFAVAVAVYLLLEMKALRVKQDKELESVKEDAKSLAAKVDQQDELINGELKTLVEGYHGVVLECRDAIKENTIAIRSLTTRPQ